MHRYARVVGWGKYVPARVVTNVELSKTLDTSDEWITSRTGIRERRIAAEEETPSSMGVLAARAALASAGMTPADIDLIIAATSSPERVMPACAALIQHGLGARTVPAFDINTACSGFLMALNTAAQFVLTGAYRNVLVVGAEVYSRMLDWQDRATCVLFGDGAGAMVVQASGEPGGILSCVAGNDGSGAGALYVPGIAASPIDPVVGPHAFLAMNGQQVFKFAVRAIADSSREALQRAGLTPDDLDLFIPHQANLRLIQAAALAAAIPLEKVFVNVQCYGNTAGASIPIAVCEAVESGRLREGDRVVLSSVGAGLSWATMAMEWRTTPQPHYPE